MSKSTCSGVQANLSFEFGPPLHPGEVAMDAVLASAERNASGNYREINLFELEQ